MFVIYEEAYGSVVAIPCHELVCDPILRFSLTNTESPLLTTVQVVSCWLTHYFRRNGNWTRVKVPGLRVGLISLYSIACSLVCPVIDGSVMAILPTSCGRLEPVLNFLTGVTSQSHTPLGIKENLYCFPDPNLPVVLSSPPGSLALYLVHIYLYLYLCFKLVAELFRSLPCFDSNFKLC